jgi:hypothetical protein
MMKKINLLSFLLSLLIIAQTVAAQCTVNGEDVPCEQLWAGLASIGWIFAIIGIIVVIGTAFWIWMFIDCIKRDFKDKTLWIILLLLTNSLGAIIYFFVVKNKKAPSQPALAPKI